MTEEPTNQDRSRRAERAISIYAVLEGRTDELGVGEPTETLFSDMLADLMHYAHCGDIDFQNCLDVAAMHFDAEIAEAGRGS